VSSESLKSAERLGEEWRADPLLKLMNHVFDRACPGASMEPGTQRSRVIVWRWWIHANLAQGAHDDWNVACDECGWLQLKLTSLQLLLEEESKWDISPAEFCGKALHFRLLPVVSQFL